MMPRKLGKANVDGLSKEKPSVNESGEEGCVRI
jgi:hypothetical protein